MTATLPQADTSAAVVPRDMVVAVVTSLGFHLLAAWYWWPFANDSTAVHATPALRIQFRSPIARKEALALTEIAVQSQRATPLPAPPPASTSPQQHQQAAPAPRAELDLSNIDQAIKDAASEPGRAQHTANSAVVMNSSLLKRLNATPRRKGVTPEDQLPEQNTSFAGGTWTDLIRIGGSCFRVQRANPLEPISHDMWFPAACPPCQNC